MPHGGQCTEDIGSLAWPSTRDRRAARNLCPNCLLNESICLNKGRRVQSRLIRVFLDSDGDNVSGITALAIGSIQHNTGQQEPAVTLNAIRQIIVQEVGKTECEFKHFKDDICKALDSLECWVDSRLVDISQRI